MRDTIAMLGRTDNGTEEKRFLICQICGYPNAINNKEICANCGNKGELKMRVSKSIPDNCTYNITKSELIKNLSSSSYVEIGKNEKVFINPNNHNKVTFKTSNGYTLELTFSKNINDATPYNATLKVRNESNEILNETEQYFKIDETYHKTDGGAFGNLLEQYKIYDFNVTLGFLRAGIVLSNLSTVGKVKVE